MLKKIFGAPESDASDGEPMLSEILARKGGYLLPQEIASILQHATELQLNADRSASDMLWLTDFIANIGNVIKAERELDSAVQNRAQPTTSTFRPTMDEASEDVLSSIVAEDRHPPSTAKAKVDPKTPIPPFVNPVPIPPARPLPPLPNTIKKNELVVQPSVFVGEKSRARQWLEDYEAAADANGWSEAIVVKYFPTYLAKAARDWYVALVQPLGSTSWSVVRTKFVRYYIGLDERAAINREISRARQGREECASDFMGRFVRLLNIGRPEQTEMEKVQEVRLRLLDIYQDRLIGHKPRTFEALNDLCLEIEARMESNRLRRPFGFGRDGKNRDRNNSSGTQGGDNRQESKTRQNGEKAPKPTVRCDHCGYTGHTREKCYKLHGRPETSKKPVRTTPNEAKPSAAVEQVKAISSQPPSSQTQSAPPKITVLRGPCGAVMSTAAVGPPPIPHPVKINQQAILAMVDCGSEASLMDASLAAELLLQAENSEVGLVGVNKSQVDCRGVVTVTLEIKIRGTTKMLSTQFIVIENCVAPVILGVELCGWLKILVSMSKREIYFEDDRTGIRLEADVVLPSRSQQVVSAALPYFIEAGAAVITVPFSFNNSLLIANSVSEVCDHKIECLLVNLERSPLLVPGGTQIGTYLMATDAKPTSDSLMRISEVVGAVQIGETSELINVGETLSIEQINDLQQLLREHQNAFSINGELGECDKIEHKIELEPDATPFVEPLRRRPLPHREEANRQVEKMLAEGVLEHSSSPWSSAYVLVRKKAGDMRLCIDFRRLNSKTKKNVFPLPNVEDCLSTMAGNVYFSTLDLASGYWQIKVAEEDRELTAFRTETGLYQFRRMPFGLCNAPASFQRLMNALFSGLVGVHLQIFIDDLCIATATWEEHLVMLKKVFLLLEDAHLKLKPSKCILGAEQVTFLGHELSKEGIRQEKNKVRAIGDLPAPTDVKALQRTLGLFNFYRKFVPNFAQLSAPLTQLLKAKVVYEWGKEQDDAFETLKKELTKETVLAHWNYRDPALLKTDASRSGIAAILLQQQEGIWRLVVCCSRRLSEAELNYGISDLEALAIVYSVTKLRNYLLGVKFTILTDHCALCAMKVKTPNSPRLHRWSLLLSEYDFSIKYVKGSWHRDVDCLSRAPVCDAEDKYLPDAISAAADKQTPWPLSVAVTLPIDTQGWRALLENDEEAKPHWEKARKRVKGYKIYSGLLYFENRLLVPVSKRLELVREAHDATGHGGGKATTSYLAHVWWPTMAQTVQEFVTNCAICQARKAERQRPAGSMNSFKATKPLELVALDCLGPIAESIAGRRHVLVMVDTFSRFLDAVALTDVKGETLAPVIEAFIGRFGAPTAILTDNSPSFLNNSVRGVFDAFQITHRLSTPHHHDGNAQVERAIGSLTDKLALLTHDPANSMDWERELSKAVLAINTSVHSSTLFSPFELFFGRPIVKKSELVSSESSTEEDYVELCELRRDRWHADAVAAQSNAQKRSSQYFERRHRMVEFAIGDKVLVKDTSRRGKLQNRYLSQPFTVMERENDIYVVENELMGRLQRHVNHLKRFHSNNSHQADNILAAVSMFSRKELTIIAVVCLARPIPLVPAVEEIQFPEVPVVSWTSSNSYATDGTVTVTAMLRVGSPCPVLNQYRVDPTMAQELVGAIQVCDQVFRNEVGNKIARLASPAALASAANLVGRGGQKRSLTELFLLVSAVANGVFTSVVAYHTNNQIGDLMHQNQLLEAKLQGLNKALNITMLQSAAQQEAANLTLQLVANNVRRLDQIQTREPVLAMIGASIISRLHLLGSYLEQVELACRHKQPNMELLGLLFQTDKFEQIDGSSIYPESLVLQSPWPNTVQITFVGRHKSQDTSVYQVCAFHYMGDLEGEPKMFEYIGPRFVMRNSAMNCTMGIGQAPGPYVSIECSRKNYLDRSLQSWHQVKREMSTQYYDFFPWSYVYCYGEEITLAKQTVECPPYPFKLHYTVAWSTPTYNYSHTLC